MNFDPKYKVENCVSKDECRPFINQILVERVDDKTGRMVATDGHMLAVVPCDLDATDIEGKIDHVSLKEGRRGRYEKNRPTIKLRKKHVSVRRINGEQSIRPRASNDDKFPEYKKITDSALANRGVSFGINPKLLLKVAEAIGSSEMVTVFLGKTVGKDAVIVTRLDEDVTKGFGLIMPLRK